MNHQKTDVVMFAAMAEAQMTNDAGNKHSRAETQNPQQLAAHTCVDFPHMGCAACEAEKKYDVITTPKKGNPPCDIPVLRADKGPK